MCKECKLSMEDLEVMTIGDCIDYIDTYITMKNPDESKKSNVRQATQTDFDNF